MGFPVLPLFVLVRLPTRFHPFHAPFPATRLQTPGQTPEAPPDPTKSTQGKVKANRRAAGGTRTGETGITPAQRESEPVKTSLYGSCNPIFQSECEPTKEWVETGGNDSHPFGWQAQHEPTKDLYRGSCNPISTFRSGAPGRNHMGIYPPI